MTVVLGNPPKLEAEKTYPIAVRIRGHAGRIVIKDGASDKTGHPNAWHC
jgi:hypothetical protein